MVKFSDLIHFETYSFSKNVKWLTVAMPLLETGERPERGWIEARKRDYR